MIQYLIVIQRIPFSTLFPQLIYPFQYASMKNDDEMKISYSFIESFFEYDVNILFKQLANNLRERKKE